MKKNSFLAFTAGILVGLSCLVAIPSKAAPETMPETVSETYPQTFVVVAADDNNDILTLRTAAGFLYQVRGVEDWTPGDMVAAIMDDNGTPEIFDDAVLATRYTGAAWDYEVD